MLAFDHGSFSKNRTRLLQHHIGQQLFDAVVADAQERHLLFRSALHGGWHAAGSHGESEELQAP